MTMMMMLMLWLAFVVADALRECKVDATKDHGFQVDRAFGAGTGQVHVIVGCRVV